MGKEKKLKIGVVPHTMNKHVGLFDFYALNGEIMNFLSRKKYYWIEKEHSEKKTGEGYEIIIEYYGSKKVDAYVKFEVTIKIEITRAERVSIEGKGESWKGSFRTIISSDMTKNYLGRFGKEGFSNFIRQIYEKYIIKKRLSKMEEKLFVETYELINKLKEILGQPQISG